LNEDPKPEAAAAAVARPAGPVRGEKQWQQWAGDNEVYLTNQMFTANKRIPYKSDLMLDQELNEDPKPAAAAGKRPPVPIRGEKQW
jgi:hypothetical protein